MYAMLHDRLHEYIGFGYDTFHIYICIEYMSHRYDPCTTCIRNVRVRLCGFIRMRLREYMCLPRTCASVCALHRRQPYVAVHGMCIGVCRCELHILVRQCE